MLDYSIYHKKEEYPLGNKKQDGENNQRNLVAKSLDNEMLRDMLSGCIPQDGLFVSELSSFLREVRISEYEFSAGKPVSDINIITQVLRIIILFICLMISWTMH